MERGVAGPVSIIEGIAQAVGLLGRLWRHASGALALTGFLGAAIAFAVVNHDLGRLGWLCLAYLAAGLMAQGALLRTVYGAADRSLEPGLAGFQWGAVEWRLLGVVALRAMLFGLLGALLVTLFMAVYIGIASAEAGPGFAAATPERWRRTLDPIGWTVVSTIVLAGGAGLAWVGLRLFVAPAATVARSRVQLLSTWAMTRGHVLPTLAMAAVILAPAAAVVVLWAVARVLTHDGLGDPRAVTGAVGAALSFSHAFLSLPLSVGLMSYLYGRLHAPDVGAT